MTPSLWAPQARTVELVLDDGRHALVRDEGGWWRGGPDLAGGDPYAFSLDGGDPRPDPRGLRLPDGPHGRSAAFDVDALAWTDQDWRGVPLEGAVIYEAHVGTFTPDGTLDAAVERLPHLVELGVDVVELLPLASFPGRHNWGYDGVAPYSVHEVYGGPAALHRFVDAAHGLGLAVCLDVVYNHLGPDGNYLGEIGPYFNDHYVTPWGQALNLDGAESQEVRRWVLDNARQWLRDFHVDGLRLDAVHELHDDSALHVLEEMAREVDVLAAETGRTLWLVAESDRNDPRTVTPRGAGDAVGGLGMHGQWADDVHHALHVALTGETQGYYADFADPDALAKVQRTPFFHDGTMSTFRGRHPRAAGRPGDRRPAGTSSRPCRPTTRSATAPRATGSPERSSTSTRDCWPAGRRSCSPRRGRRCCSWGRSGAPGRRGSSSPTTPTPTSPPRRPPAARRSSARTAGPRTRSPTRRTPTPSPGPGSTGTSSSASRTPGCCGGTPT